MQKLPLIIIAICATLALFALYDRASRSRSTVKHTPHVSYRDSADAADEPRARIAPAPPKAVVSKLRPTESLAELNAQASEQMRARLRAAPTPDDEFLAEPVAPWAAIMESETWNKVVTLPGVKSAVVQCRTRSCKVTMTGDINPAAGFDLRGLTFYKAEADGLVYFYDKNMDVE